MLSSDASKALQVAIAVAERAGREYASEEDVLLGLLDAPTAQQIVTAVLSAAGLDADKIRSELQRHALE